MAPAPLYGRESPSRRIIDEVTSWTGVTAEIGSRGELSLRVARREIGHLHGDSAAHFFFGRDLWAELMAQGRISDHPVFPGREGAAARRIETEHDIGEIIALLRLNYDAVTTSSGAIA